MTRKNSTPADAGLGDDLEGEDLEDQCFHDPYWATARIVSLRNEVGEQREQIEWLTGELVSLRNEVAERSEEVSP